METAEDARKIKLEMDRAKACSRDLEAERKAKTAPLNERVSSINFLYQHPHQMLTRLLDQMKDRLELFIKAERDRREAAAAAAAIKAAEAERLAREAERVERERLDDAAKGEIGVDVAKVIGDADDAYEAYQVTARAAEIAERETHVKVSGGFSRAIGMRKHEALKLTNYTDALDEMGLTEEIVQSMFKSARVFRKLHGRLPKGIISTVEEHL